MKTTPIGLRLALLVAAFLLVSQNAQAQKPANDASAGIAAALQPFVDKPRAGRGGHAGGGQGQGAEPRSGRLRRHRRQEADADRRAVLDRLAVQADHRHGADDAGGRGQGEAGRSGGEVSAGVQGPVAGRRSRTSDHILLKKPKHPITVRNVLSHTSGLPFKSAMENADARPAAAARRGAQLRHDAAAVRAGHASTSIPTPASTRRAASSRSSAACPTRRSWTSGCSSRSA